MASTTRSRKTVKTDDIIARLEQAKLIGSEAALTLPAPMAERARALLAAKGKPVVRSVHHMACTGGSLLARSLEAQRNVKVLSEIEPFSDMVLQRPTRTFAPTDVLGLARGTTFGISDDLVSRVFLASLGSLAEGLNERGQTLVLREHSHSRYCTRDDALERPSMRALLRLEFEVHSIVSVRHPIDSWLGMTGRKWISFRPATLDEYCRRYQLFLDEHDDAEVFKYEELVEDPDAIVKSMCDALQMEYSDGWQALLPAIRMTGDSGRTGHVIAPRPRRGIPLAMREEAKASSAFAALCERLGYERGF